MHNTARLACLALALLLAGCFEPSKAEILEKAEGVTDKDELRRALGDPDDIGKVGPVETWVYNADNGTVTFIITGSLVALQAAGGKEQKQ